MPSPTRQPSLYHHGAPSISPAIAISPIDKELSKNIEFDEGEWIEANYKLAIEVLKKK